MRTTLLPLFALLFSTRTNAQITAGQVPPGQSAYDLVNNLALSNNFTSDSIGLELDCDDAMDAWAILYRGFPAVDAPHYAVLRFDDTDMEVCLDLSPGFQQRPQYYTAGQPLTCPGGFNWEDNVNVTLGDLGGFLATGPSVVDSLYIAYQQAGVVGWIRLSFDITDDAVINLQVHRVLSVCTGAQSVGQHAQESYMTLYPNPTDGQAVRVAGANATRRIELIDASGRIIAAHTSGARTITPPEASGTYLVRVLYNDGQFAMLPLVRL